MSRQTILSLVLIGILAFAGYFFYTNYNGTSDNSEKTMDDVRLKIDRLRARLRDLEYLRKLDLGANVKTLDDPFFMSLVETAISTTTTIKAGRENPFLTIATSTTGTSGR